MLDNNILNSDNLTFLLKALSLKWMSVGINEYEEIGLRDLSPLVA